MISYQLPFRCDELNLRQNMIPKLSIMQGLARKSTYNSLKTHNFCNSFSHSLFRYLTLSIFIPAFYTIMICPLIISSLIVISTSNPSNTPLTPEMIAMHLDQFLLANRAIQSQTIPPQMSVAPNSANTNPIPDNSDTQNPNGLTCGQNEIFTPSLGHYRPTCESPPDIPADIMVPGCNCVAGYILDRKDGTCIPKENCLTATSKWPLYNTFNDYHLLQKYYSLFGIDPQNLNCRFGLCENRKIILSPGPGMMYHVYYTYMYVSSTNCTKCTQTYNDYNIQVFN